MRRSAISRAAFLVCAALATLLAPPRPGRCDLILSEIADPVESYQARFVEVCNTVSTSVSLVGWTLRRYSNGQTTWAEVDLSEAGALPARGVLAVAYSRSGFESYFRSAAGLYNGYVTGNGNDVYALARNGQITDIYGEVGVDGTSRTWCYADAVAVRHSPVLSASATWRAQEWTIVARAGAELMTPGSRPLGLAADDPDGLAADVSFGSIESGSSLDLAVTITNRPASSASLTITVVQLVSGNAAFAALGPMPRPLASGETTSILLRYGPGAAKGARHEATLLVQCNDPYPPRFRAVGRTRNVTPIARIRANCEAGEAPGVVTYSIANAIVTAQGIGPRAYAVQEDAPSTRGAGAYIYDEAGVFLAAGARVGDRITVDVTTVRCNGLLQLVPIPATLRITGRDNMLPEPLVLDGLSALGDATEGLLVGLRQVWIVSGATAADLWQCGARYSLTDSLRQVEFVVAPPCATWEATARPRNGVAFALIGIGSQNDPASPVTGGVNHRILARNGRQGDGTAEYFNIHATPTDVCRPGDLAPKSASRLFELYP